MRHATRSRTPIGASETPVIPRPYQPRPSRSALLLLMLGAMRTKRDQLAWTQMAKPKTRYVCQACGSLQHRWQGQCPDCAEWNSLVQEAAEVSSIFAAKHNLQGGGRVIPLVGLETPAALPERLPSGIPEFDRAIGGGIVAGSAMLVGGDPGIGKSTLLLQVAARLASAGKSVIYVSGEASAEQVRLRAVRLGLGGAPVRLAAATSVRDILTTMGGV